MIVFELICTDRHRFEGWFASSEEFERQRSRGLLCCPVCSDSGIEKLLTAKIGKADPDPVVSGSDPTPPARAPGMQKLNELIEYVLLHSDNVGENFASEARRIHRGESPHRNIRGVATGQQTQELLEEGIAVLPLPVPPRKDWH